MHKKAKNTRLIVMALVALVGVHVGFTALYVPKPQSSEIATAPYESVEGSKDTNRNLPDLTEAPDEDLTDASTLASSSRLTRLPEAVTVVERRSSNTKTPRSRRTPNGQFPTVTISYDGPAPTMTAANWYSPSLKPNDTAAPQMAYKSKKKGSSFIANVVKKPAGWVKSLGSKLF